MAATTGHMPALNISGTPRTKRAPLSQQHRLQLLRRALNEQHTPTRVRVAACLVLLYAQPMARLVRLSVDDIPVDDDQVLLRLGTPATPAPEPFGELLATYLRERANMNTATNADTRWLFPGGRAGQPLAPSGLSRQLRTFGMPTTQARTAAFRQLVLQAPAPVIAHALGYNPNTAHQHHADAGGTWARYTSDPT